MRTVGAVAIGIACATGTPPAMGASRADNIKVVRNDFGGRIRIRAAEVARLADAGIRVEIRGRSCLSSCTMYLGLPDTCVEPKTSFGFHAPSFYGAKLSARDFKYWSNVIASHYPEPIRSWYLKTARDTTTGFHRISGENLIKMGFQQCD